MKLIGKASGELGRTFLQDIEVFFSSLEESYQLCLNHISMHQIHKVDQIVAKLTAIGHPLADVKDETHYIGNALNVVVQSRRLIFILESPQTKVAAGSVIKLVWTTAGGIPYVKIAIQVSSLMQQAQDKAKKTYVTIAEQAKTNGDAIGTFEWEVTHEFVKQHGKHGNYCFKVSYSPPPPAVDPSAEEQKIDVKKQDFIGTSLVGKSVTFETSVKAKSDTFKLHDKSKSKSATSSPAVASPAVASPVPASSPSTSATVSYSSPTVEKQDKQGGDTKSSAKASASAALGKATNFMKRK